MTILRKLACHHEGVELEGLVAMPDAPGPHPAVMVMHNAHGLGEQVKQSAQLLAAEGYVALVTDMYGGGSFFADPRAAGPVIAPLWENPMLLRSRVVAWYELLKVQPGVDPARMAAIGYCFGGRCVLELARSGADVRAVVSYHGILTTAQPAQPGAITAQVAVYTGGKDPFAPPEHVEAFRQEMQAAGAQWQLMEFGNVLHAFTDRDAAATPVEGLAYDAIADRVSWAGTLALLGEVLALPA